MALAIEALAAGKHVVVEKPVALRARDVARLAAAAKRARRTCMPAMCMRFWPGWTWLKQHIDSGAYGPVRSATFHRLGCRPHWAADFYADDSRCGGALFDLHVHDADFVRWCFGDPASVVATGAADHLTTLYRYDHSPGVRAPAHVVAEGGWDHAAGFPFTMRFVVVFENATAVFDLAADPPLTLWHRGQRQSIPTDPTTAWDAQARALLDAISRGQPSPVPPSDAARVIQILEAERESLRTGRPVAIPAPQA